MALPLSSTRLQPLFPSLIVFILLSLPMMIYFIDSKPKKNRLDIKILKEGEKEYFGKMASFFSISIAIPMLISFFFFNDALITITNNYSIYMERVFSVSDDIKNYLLLAVLLMSAIGGVISGWIADKIGALKTLKFILVGWIILIPLIATAKSLILLSIFSSLVGLFVGSSTTVTRAYLSEILKKEELSYGFSFYTIAERFATLFGPLTWGGIIAVLGTQNTSYRVAMLSMALFVFVGLIILLRWNREPKLLNTINR
jgi:UMF1 family MFS transporter